MADQQPPLAGERIAYVINSVEGGGAAAPVPGIARLLMDQGATVRVFALARRDGLGLPAMIAAGLDPLVRDEPEHDRLGALRWLSRALREWRPTRLWTSLSHATILGLLVGPRLGVPVVCWQHAAFLKPWNERLLRWLQRRAELWIGDSPAITALTARRLGVEPARLACWPIVAVDESAPPATPWQAGEPLRLGSLGRLHPVKGYDVLIEALANLARGGFVPPAPMALTIAGDGGERSRLEAQLAAAGLTGVGLPGFVTDAPGFLAGLHLYLQPSRSEGFCIAAHEAMNAGLPVVGSAVGEIAATIEDGRSGLLVPPGDPIALAAALRHLLDDPASLAPLGAAARERVRSLYSAAAFRRAGEAVVGRISGRAGA
ncbi:glycosyltransferase [Sphingomonas ginkgonis]|uniref:Glycosyltransferase n=1 Tax=Sphingomonas ginkgonis TaxID=2315330 RepID=A0A3R9YND4_9SPHN|nr:glycosyltransferase [Sphingomonas ginkgonis]RST31730.1 glycosyltransferase [Sphingomonas ginkgonis]